LSTKSETTGGGIIPTVIIDTDIAIDFLRGDLSARNLLFQLWEEDRAYLSILSVYELHAGMKSHERRATDDFIAACNLEPLTLEIAKKGGELYRHYRADGFTLTTVDCLIAATSLIADHKIATRNAKHYPDKKLLYKLKMH
jgi:predicted nucleic acid-binding protein